MPSRRRKLEYLRVLNMKRDASDPWRELANAIVELAAEDYRELMTKRIKRGLTMTDLELRLLDSRIREIKLFFESDYGCLLAHGLNMVIWERLQGEFAEQNAQIEEALAVRRKAICRFIANNSRIDGIIAAGIISYIDAAPTIVPAEGGGEE